MANSYKNILGSVIPIAKTIGVMLTLGAVPLVACSQAPTGSQAVAPGSQAAGGVTHIDVSRAKAYHSMRELAADAELVVRVVATSKHSVELVQGYPQDPLPTPYTITTVAPREVLKGTLGNLQVLKIRQIGSSDGTTVVEHAPAILQPGHPYLLFLDVFTYGPGQQTDEYVLVGGGAGLFADNGATVSSLDADSPDLPQNASLGDVKAVLAN
jgi:hypothetical protein